ncbi:unnamed protein product, partial [marine sediment metagenome]
VKGSFNLKDAKIIIIANLILVLVLIFYFYSSIYAIPIILTAFFFGVLYNIYSKKFPGADLFLSLSLALLFLFGAIVPKDDGFHESKKLSAEWWYFDGVFPNDYSFHLGIRTFTRKKRGRAILIFELYQNETILFEKKKRFSFKDVETNNEYPSVKIQNRTILDFNIQKYNDQDEWVYHIACTIDDTAADLYFTSITQGFKIETDKESWTVAVPKAKVTGTIEYAGKKLPVDGIGGRVKIEYENKNQNKIGNDNDFCIF